LRERIEEVEIERLVYYGGKFEGGGCGLLKMEHVFLGVLSCVQFIHTYIHCSIQGCVWLSFIKLSFSIIL